MSAKPAETSGREQVVAKVQAWLADNIPRFLTNRALDVTRLREAAQKGDFETMRLVGHNLKGVGSGYGFVPITVLGQGIEAAARARDALAVQALTDGLDEYLRQVRVVSE